MYQPLADRIRPQSLDEVLGQGHILGSDGLLRRVIDSGKIPNMVFYGPSGTGKTTVANIIAQRSGRTLRRLNATTASLADIREVMDQVGTLLAPNGVLLYLDEIQYFNKKQQQSLLEFIENGKITLIASTTENPYFTIFNAILSRSTVFEFKMLTADDIFHLRFAFQCFVQLGNFFFKRFQFLQPPSIPAYQTIQFPQRTAFPKGRVYFQKISGFLIIPHIIYPARIIRPIYKKDRHSRPCCRLP